MIDLFHMGESGAGLVLLLIKITLPLIGGLAAMSLLRRVSASLRFVIIFLALAAGIVIPAFNLAIPRWPILTAPVIQVLPAATGHDMAAPSGYLPSDNRPVATSGGPSEIGPITRYREILGGKSIDPVSVLLSLWLAGMALTMIRMTRGYQNTNRVIRTATPVADPDWLNLVNQLRENLGVVRPVALGFHSASDMPAVMGLRQPMIVLPFAARHWSAERRKMVLLHELSHVRRYDSHLFLIAQFSCALNWFNPFMWLALRHLIFERERACDEMVLQAGARADTYAKTILEIVARHPARPVLASYIASPHELELRLLSIVESKSSHAPVEAKVIIAATVLSALMMIPLAAISFAVPASESLPEVGTTEGTSFPAPNNIASGFTDRPSTDRTSIDVAPPVAGVRMSAQTRALENQDVVGILAKKLRSNEPATRRAGIRELRALGSTHPVVRNVISRLYAESETDEALFKNNFTVRHFSPSPQAPLEPFLIALIDEDDANRAKAAHLLGERGNLDATEHLIGMLDDDCGAVRYWAIRSLGTLRDPSAVPDLVGALSDEEEWVRYWAVRGLGGIGSGQATGPLVDMLANPAYKMSRDLERWTVRSLGSTGGSQAVEALISELHNPIASIREWAVRSLGNLGDKRAIEPLIPLINDEQSSIRNWTIRVLGNLESG